MPVEGSTPADRRPVAARRLGIIQRLAAALARANVSANTISLSSVVFAVISGGSLAATASVGDGTARALMMLAAAGMQLRLLANLLDGLVAVEGGRRTPAGELYNEVPDRVSDAVVLIAAGFGISGNIHAGYVAAVLAIMTAYIRAVGKGAGAGSDFGGPMAKQQRMMLLSACAIALAVLPVAWRPEATLGTQSFGLLGLGLIVIAAGSALTCVLRLKRIAVRLHEGAQS